MPTKLERTDYEFVLPDESNSLNREMVRFRIDGKYWRVKRRCSFSIESEGIAQRVLANYQVENSLGSVRYISVAEIFSCVLSLGFSAEEVFMISGLEENLDDSLAAQSKWVDARKRSSR